MIMMILINEIADMIGKDTRSAKVWLQNMNEIMKLEK
jgi:hypothetical protein